MTVTITGAVTVGGQVYLTEATVTLPDPPPPPPP